MAEPLWLEDPVEPLPRPAWRGRADVIIIGGGVTGCSCALALADAGLRVRLHEAREIASGASGRNGGFALRGAALAYDVARERLGSQAAARLWRLTERYLEARFGKQPFSPEERREFLREARELGRPPREQKAA